MRKAVLLTLAVFLAMACRHTYSGYAVEGSLFCAERVAEEMNYDVVWNNSSSFVASRWGRKRVLNRILVRVDSSVQSDPRLTLVAGARSRDAEIIVYQCGL